jgi:hemoglobin
MKSSQETRKKHFAGIWTSFSSSKGSFCFLLKSSPPQKIHNYAHTHTKKRKKMEPSQRQLLHRIGGPAALEAAVDIFYEKLVQDENLVKFFENVDMEKLKDHQRKFLTLALTNIPKDIDVASLMKEKHKRLFAMGLNETHFDLVVGHLEATLQGLQVQDGWIQEMIGIIAPLRTVFQTGRKEHLLDKIGGPAALEAAVDIFYERILNDASLTKFFKNTNINKLKMHQRNFLTLALTEVPPDMNIPELIATKHALNETHFDSVADHLMSTLKNLQVRDEHVDEIISIIAPLRVVFEEGAKKFSSS